MYLVSWGDPSTSCVFFSIHPVASFLSASQSLHSYQGPVCCHATPQWNNILLKLINFPSKYMITPFFLPSLVYAQSTTLVHRTWFSSVNLSEILSCRRDCLLGWKKQSKRTSNHTICAVSRVLHSRGKWDIKPPENNQTQPRLYIHLVHILWQSLWVNMSCLCS